MPRQTNTLTEKKSARDRTSYYAFEYTPCCFPTAIVEMSLRKHSGISYDTHF